MPSEGVSTFRAFTPDISHFKAVQGKEGYVVKSEDGQGLKSTGFGGRLISFLSGANSTRANREIRQDFVAAVGRRYGKKAMNYAAKHVNVTSGKPLSAREVRDVMKGSVKEALKGYKKVPPKTFTIGPEGGKINVKRTSAKTPEQLQQGANRAIDTFKTKEKAGTIGDITTGYGCVFDDLNGVLNASPNLLEGGPVTAKDWKNAHELPQQYAQTYHQWGTELSRAGGTGPALFSPKFLAAMSDKDVTKALVEFFDKECPGQGSAFGPKVAGNIGQFFSNLMPAVDELGKNAMRDQETSVRDFRGAAKEMLEKLQDKIEYARAAYSVLTNPEFLAKCPQEHRQQLTALGEQYGRMYRAMTKPGGVWQDMMSLAMECYDKPDLMRAQIRHKIDPTAPQPRPEPPPLPDQAHQAHMTPEEIANWRTMPPEQRSSLSLRLDIQLREKNVQIPDDEVNGLSEADKGLLFNLGYPIPPPPDVRRKLTDDELGQYYRLPNPDGSDVEAIVGLRRQLWQQGKDRVDVAGFERYVTTNLGRNSTQEENQEYLRLNARDRESMLARLGIESKGPDQPLSPGALDRLVDADKEKLLLKGYAIPPPVFLSVRERGEYQSGSLERRAELFNLGRARQAVVDTGVTPELMVQMSPEEVRAWPTMTAPQQSSAVTRLAIQSLPEDEVISQITFDAMLEVDKERLTRLGYIVLPPGARAGMTEQEVGLHIKSDTPYEMRQKLMALAMAREKRPIDLELAMLRNVELEELNQWSSMDVDRQTSLMTRLRLQLLGEAVTLSEVQLRALLDPDKDILRQSNFNIPVPPPLVSESAKMTPEEQRAWEKTMTTAPRRSLQTRLKLEDQPVGQPLDPTDLQLLTDSDKQKLRDKGYNVPA
jgi:predicted Fe-S protein YdhL (DUF1289 family)